MSKKRSNKGQPKSGTNNLRQAKKVAGQDLFRISAANEKTIAAGREAISSVDADLAVLATRRRNTLADFRADLLRAKRACHLREIVQAEGLVELTSELSSVIDLAESTDRVAEIIEDFHVKLHESNLEYSLAGPVDALMKTSDFMLLSIKEIHVRRLTGDLCEDCVQERFDQLLATWSMVDTSWLAA